MTFLSELPHTANGSTLVRMFLAARSCLARGDKLELRASNEISKMCNYLVRGLRHGLCSWISMTAKDFSDDEQYSASIDELFARVAGSPNTDYLCTLLRATRDIQNKTPSHVHKAVDMGDGTVQVMAHEVPRSVWSTLIARTIDVLRKHMLPWFANVDILNLFLDPRNALVFSSDPDVCKVLVKRDGKTEEFKLSSLITDFGSEPEESFLKILVHVQISMSYLSYGALRGTETDRIPDFQTFQFLLNRLTFQVSRQAVRSFLLQVKESFCLLTTSSFF